MSRGIQLDEFAFGLQIIAVVMKLGPSYITLLIMISLTKKIIAVRRRQGSVFNAMGYLSQDHKSFPQQVNCGN